MNTKMEQPMEERQIEAFVASPPERDELCVQLFKRDGGQCGEIFRQQGRWFIEFWTSTSRDVVRFDADELSEVIATSLKELKDRLRA